MMEKRIGVITHYPTRPGVGLPWQWKGGLALGDTIHIRCHTLDFTRMVDSIQMEHEDVNQAKKGENAGIRAKGHAREHDVVYKILEG
jgi:putative protease